MNPGTSEHVLRLLFWESTAGCNLSCAHCRRIDGDTASDLPTSQARDMLSGLAGLGRQQGTSPVIVFSGGEPLQRGDIVELIAHAAGLSLTAALATNGTLLDDSTALGLKSAGLSRVAVSIDGAQASTHDAIRNQPGCFDRALQGIEALRRCGIPFQLNFTLTRSNAGDLAAIYSLAESLGAAALHIFVLVPVGCGRELAQTEVLEPEQYERRLLDIARLAMVGRVQVKVTCGPQYERIIRQHGIASAMHHKGSSSPGSAPHGKHSKGCLAGTGVVFVSHAGTVFPCGYMPVDCGSVLSSTLIDIWRNSPRLKDFRDVSKLKGKCGSCEYKLICGGCRARALAVTGDCFAEEPSCAYLPSGRGGSA